MPQYDHPYRFSQITSTALSILTGGKPNQNFRNGSESKTQRGEAAYPDQRETLFELALRLVRCDSADHLVLL